MKQVKVLFFILTFFLSSFGNVARASYRDQDKIKLLTVSQSVMLILLTATTGMTGYNTYANYGMHQVIIPSEPTSELSVCAESIVGNRYSDPNAENCLRQIMRGEGTQLYLYATNPAEGASDCVEGQALYGGRAPLEVTGEEASECEFSVNGTFLGYSHELEGYVYEEGAQILFPGNQDVWVQVEAN